MFDDNWNCVTMSLYCLWHLTSSLVLTTCTGLSGQLPLAINASRKNSYSVNFPRPVTLVLRVKLLAMVMAVNVWSRQSRFPRVIMTAHNDQLPVDLIAQLVEHSTDWIGFAEVKVEIPSRPEIFRSPLPIDYIAFKTAMMKSNLFLSSQFNCMFLKYIVHRPPSFTSYHELTQWPASSWPDSSTGRALYRLNRFRRGHS